MAVSNPNQIDLSSSYGNILRALDSQRQAISETPPDTLGVLAHTAGKTIGAYAGMKIEGAHEKDLATFKNSLEQQLQEHAAKVNSDAEGYQTLTQTDVDNEFKKQGITDPKFIPQLPNGTIRAKPDELQKYIHKGAAHVEVERLATSLEKTDPKRAAALRIVANDSMPEGTSKQLKEIILPEDAAKEDRPQKITDPATGDIFDYYPKTGAKIQITGPVEPTPPGELATKVTQLHPAEIKTLQKAKEDFTKRTKDLVDVIKNTDKLKTSVLSDNKVGKFNDQVSLVKLSGLSAAKISQGEIVRDAGSQALADQATQLLSTKTSGKWSPENKRLIASYADLLKNEAQEALLKQHAAYSDSVSSDMRGRVAPDFIKTELAKPIPQLSTALNGGYKSADEVKAAFHAGKIDKGTATAILQKSFGYK